MLRWRDFDAVITEYDLETQAAGLRLVQRLNTVTFPPVLIISTANPTVERLRSMLGTRVNYLVFKPIDLDELKSVLSRDLARRSVQYQLAASV
jgi:DNA-binding NtrC family response regulator